jgi:hypothetical protein
MNTARDTAAPPLPLLLSMKTASQMLSVSRATLYRLGRSGHLVLKQIGCRTLVDAASVRALAENAPRLEAPVKRKRAA